MNHEAIIAAAIRLVKARSNSKLDLIQAERDLDSAVNSTSRRKPKTVIVDRKQLQSLVDYNWDDENNDYQEQHDDDVAQRSHIFHVIVGLSNALNEATSKADDFVSKESKTGSSPSRS